MRIVTILLAVMAILFSIKKTNEARLLRNEIRALKSERPDIWKESCYRAVNQSCYYGDCAVTPIEIMQEKICDRVPEDL